MKMIPIKQVLTILATYQANLAADSSLNVNQFIGASATIDGLILILCDLTKELDESLTEN